jgi:hypothetical protein
MPLEPDDPAQRHGVARDRGKELADARKKHAGMMPQI